MLHQFPSLKLQYLIYQDLRIVAESRLNEYFKDIIRQRTQRDIDELIDAIVEKAEGVFLWVHVALKILQRGLHGHDTLQELQERLNDMPSELYDLYKRMWETTSPDTAKRQLPISG
jgi:hypothetical protein